MIDLLIDVLKESIVVAGMVFAIMVVIEYINVMTHGIWQRFITQSKWKQYLLAALLGAIPGCLGSYMAVAMFSHKLFSLGATITTMVATTGDEAYLMLALFPQKTFILMGILVILALITGFLTDRFIKPEFLGKEFTENNLPIHQHEKCTSYNFNELKNNIFNPSPVRFIVSLLFTLLLAGIVYGFFMKEAETWMFFTVGIASIIVLLIILSVPKHFIEEHVWNHIIKVHLPKILIWTFIILLFISLLLKYVHIESLISDNMLLVIIAGVLIGIIPQSGPHLIFVTLFSQGTIPFSVLLANSISQDGHGMLPLLGESKKAFIVIKAIKVAVALIVGLAVYSFGF
ncbi:MAG: putative manganese transporter [Deltaproteobacteria bacterium]